MTSVKFSELTNKRKIAVQVLLEEFPEVKSTGLIMLKQLRTWWDTKYSKQDNKLCGYPIWIFSDHAFRTDAPGVYSIPLPDDNEQVDLSNAKTKKINSKQPKQKTLKDLTSVKSQTTIVKQSDNLISETEFADECRAAGITI